MLIRTLFSLLTFIMLAPQAFAEDMSSPIGTWQTINEDTQKPSSLVKITVNQGSLVGEVWQLLPGSHFKPNDLCTRCEDHLKNHPIVGLQFLWGFVPDQSGSWKEGKVLDPNNGHIYRGSLKLIDNGRKMQLRGYWGPFFRTQVWTRVNPA